MGSQNRNLRLCNDLAFVDKPISYLRPLLSTLDDIPFHSNDEKMSERDIATLESICLAGQFESLRSLLAENPDYITPRFLFYGLIPAIRAGHVQAVRMILSRGAIVSRQVPVTVLAAPISVQLPLFETLVEFGWTPNSPGFRGELLLPRVVTDLSLLRFFLEHGADPNLGTQYKNAEGVMVSEPTSGSALDAAARDGSLEAVQLLLDAGASAQNGIPLHAAAGAHPKGTNIYYPPVKMTRDFDVERVPIMAILVEKGADVNRLDQDRNMVPRLPIQLATMAGAIERVKWLLDHGADPDVRAGFYQSASETAERFGSDEMRRVMDDWSSAKHGKTH